MASSLLAGARHMMLIAVLGSLGIAVVLLLFGLELAMALVIAALTYFVRHRDA